MAKLRFGEGVLVNLPLYPPFHLRGSEQSGAVPSGDNLPPVSTQEVVKDMDFSCKFLLCPFAWASHCSPFLSCEVRTLAPDRVVAGLKLMQAKYFTQCTAHTEAWELIAVVD